MLKSAVLTTSLHQMLPFSYFMGGVANDLNLEQCGWKFLKWMMWPPLI